MLPDDDPRHGTPAGHNAGCMCRPCAAAKLAYDKLRRLDEVSGRPRKVEAFHASRRVQALYALGWTSQQIADVAGMKRQQVHQISLEVHGTVYTATLAAIESAYRALSMRKPEPVGRGARSTFVRRVNLSRRLGHAPPLAWDNIDDPDERPTDWAYRPSTRAELIADLDEQGAGISEMCAALKVSPDTLERWCVRHDQWDLFKRLKARETTQQVYRNQYARAAS